MDFLCYSHLIFCFLLILDIIDLLSCIFESSEWEDLPLLEETASMVWSDIVQWDDVSYLLG